MDGCHTQGMSKGMSSRSRCAATGQWTGGQQTGNLNTLTVSYSTPTGILTITG